MMKQNDEVEEIYTTQNLRILNILNFFVQFICAMRAHIAYINYTKKLRIFNTLNFLLCSVHYIGDCLTTGNIHVLDHSVFIELRWINTIKVNSAKHRDTYSATGQVHFLENELKVQLRSLTILFRQAALSFCSIDFQFRLTLSAELLSSLLRFLVIYKILKSLWHFEIFLTQDHMGLEISNINN